MHILIVEDDLTLASSLKSALEVGGAAVDAVRSVADAMSRALRAQYDLVILDLFVIDGATVSFSNFLRMRMPDTPILSITGSSIFANGDHTEAMSADYLIRKPVSPSEVSDIAFYLIGRGKMPKESSSV
ncbi:response regulator transcription factor [Roseobacter sp.]|uniref:response regulator transcription factor n=1 Tax=Roseobacter sp. TaxID=1907202 RepID=UPI0029670538|nr:response regulator [Roseobacter sp.]MDW3181854.1 response regulator [Roseobacter sp.]